MLPCGSTATPQAFEEAAEREVPAEFGPVGFEAFDRASTVQAVEIAVGRRARAVHGQVQAAAVGVEGDRRFFVGQRAEDLGRAVGGELSDPGFVPARIHDVDAARRSDAPRSRSPSREGARRGFEAVDHGRLVGVDAHGAGGGRTCQGPSRPATARNRAATAPTMWFARHRLGPLRVLMALVSLHPRFAGRFELRLAFRSSVPFWPTISTVAFLVAPQRLSLLTAGPWSRPRGRA